MNRLAVDDNCMMGGSVDASLDHWNVSILAIEIALLLYWMQPPVNSVHLSPLTTSLPVRIITKRKQYLYDLINWGALYERCTKITGLLPVDTDVILH